MGHCQAAIVQGQIQDFYKGGGGGGDYSLSDQQNMSAGSLLLIFVLCVSSKWGVTSHLFHSPGSAPVVCDLRRHKAI